MRRLRRTCRAIRAQYQTDRRSPLSATPRTTPCLRWPSKRGTRGGQSAARPVFFAARAVFFYALVQTPPNGVPGISTRNGAWRVGEGVERARSKTSTVRLRPSRAGGRASVPMSQHAHQREQATRAVTVAVRRNVGGVQVRELVLARPVHSLSEPLAPRRRHCAAISVDAAIGHISLKALDCIRCPQPQRQQADQQQRATTHSPRLPATSPPRGSCVPRPFRQGSVSGAAACCALPIAAQQLNFWSPPCTLAPQRALHGRGGDEQRRRAHNDGNIARGGAPNPLDPRCPQESSNSTPTH
jgi:hypothetical protein